MEERRELLDLLNKLTSDTLIMRLIDGGRHWVVSVLDAAPRPLSLESRPSGTNLISSLISSPHAIRIQFVPGAGSQTWRDSSDDGFLNDDGTPGRGTGSSVWLDRLNVTEINPIEIILGHELIHTHRMATGTDTGRIQPERIDVRMEGMNARTIIEELYVIGIRTSFTNRPITTENRLRIEQGIEEANVYEYD